MTENTREVELKATMDATGVRAGVEQAKTALGDLSKAAEREGAKAGAGVEKVGDSAEKAAAKTERATGNLISQIQRVTAARQAGDRESAAYFEAIAKQRGISGDALKPYLEELRKAEVIQKQATSSLGAMGVSAAQTAAALRQVPAQFTDIATSLASGQAPLTVFLQQGGQLKDAFGGAGAAARALGGYVLGLVNPFTVAAAAVGGLGFAYLKGAAEAEAFARTLILTGNAAGVTAQQLSAISASIAGSGVTQGAAADALNQLAATGKVGADNLGRFAAAAVQLQRVGGPAVEETVKAFAELGKSPLQASLKLNESTNFLTVSLYEQIKALEGQGKATEAARVAQEAYAAAQEQRLPALAANVGLLERAWNGVAGAIKGVGNELLNIGRADTLSSLEASLKSAQSRAARLNGGGLLDNFFRDQALASAAGYQQQIDALNKVDRLARKAADADAQRLKTIQARTEFDKIAEQSLDKQAKLAKEIERIENLGLSAGKSRAEIDKQIAAARERANDDKGAKALNTELAKQQKIVAELAGLSGDFFEEWARLPKVYKDVDQLSEAQAKLLAKQPAIREAAKAEADARKAAAKALDELLKAEQRRLDAQYKIAEQVGEQIQKLQDEEAAIGVAAAQNLSLAAAIEKVRVARLEEAAAKATAAQDYTTAAALRSEIEAREKLAGLIEAKAGRDAAKKSADDAAAEWKRASQDIERGLTDALIRGFDSGKDLAQSLRDYIVNLFKTTVVKFAVQALIGNSGSSFGGQGSGGFGWAGDGLSAFGNWMGGDSTIGNWASTAGSLLKGNGTTVGAGGSLFGVAGSAFSGGTALANAGLAGQALQGGWASIGAGNVAQGVGQIGGVAAGALGGFLGGRAVGQLVSGGYAAGGGSGNSAVNTGAAIGAAIGSIIPGLGTLIGGLIGGALGGLTNRAFGHKPKEYGDMGLEGTISAGDLTGRAYADWFQKGGWFRSDKRGTDNSPLESEIEKGLDLTARAILDNAKAWGAALALPAEQLANVTTSFKTKLTGNAQDDEAAIAAVLQGYSDALINSFGAQLTPFKQGTETTAQTLERLAFSLGSVNGVLDILGQSLLTVGVTGADAASQLLNQFGGLQQFQAASGQYLQDYYSEAERTALATKQLTAQLATVGVSLPATRDAYRQLVEAQDLNTESGRNAYAALLQLAPSFAQLVPAIEGVGNAADETARLAEEAAAKMAEAGRRVLADLAEQQAGLQVELLRAQGDLTAAAELERQNALAKLTAGLSAADAASATAAFDLVAGLRAQIQATNDAKSAAEQAAAAASQAAQAETQRVAAIANERAGLEQRLLQAQGDTAALRALELGALDASNRSILERIFALQDEQAAAAAAAQQARDLEAAQQAAADAEARRVATIANERDSLIGRLLQAQGNTAAIRERELAAIDATNREILEQIYAIEDQKEANAAAAAAAQEAARAADQMRSAWQSVTDTLMDEVRRIRGLMAGGSEQSLAGAQSRLAITTAQAMAGDQEAVRLLPSLSQAMLTIAEAQATSLIELQRIRAQTATSLENVGASLAARYGLSLPKFDVGTNYVPKTMVATIHEGEAIVPRAYNPAAGGAGVADKALLKAVEKLASKNEEQGIQIVKLNKRMAEVLDRWELGGLPPERTQ